MASTHETYEFVKVALEQASDAIDAQLRELTLLKDLELAQQKIKRLEERIDHMTADMSDHFDRRARYLCLKTEMQNVLLALHQEDNAMAQNSYKEIHDRVHASAAEKLRMFKANQKQAQADFDQELAVAAAEHKVETAKAALELRDKLANGVFAKATQRVAALDQHVRKRGREDVQDMNENLSNVQKVQKKGPGAPAEEAPAPAPTPAEEAPAPAEKAPAEEAGASTKGAEPHPGTLGTKASKTTKPKLTGAEKTAAAQAKAAEKAAAAEARAAEKAAAKAAADAEKKAAKEAADAEKAAAKAAADAEKAAAKAAAAAARQAEKEEKKVNGKKKEPPAASVSRPRGGKASKAGPVSVRQYWQDLDSTKSQYAEETNAAQAKGGQTWEKWHPNLQSWYDDAWGRVPASQKEWLAKRAQGGGSNSGGADKNEGKGGRGGRGGKGGKKGKESKESKKGKEAESESEAEAEAVDAGDAPQASAAREDKPKAVAAEPDSDNEQEEAEKEKDSARASPRAEKPADGDATDDGSGSGSGSDSDGDDDDDDDGDSARSASPAMSASHD